ncbi:MAG: membrane protein insertion efficiency factor YidD [Candidatus Latescibacteria bacterium]|jgi:uncharacterized protein|nr:membrane protein insertion efficiency factor YidD [Candidatus Latescibacterota bacterium]
MNLKKVAAPVKITFIGFIKIYQKILSPLLGGQCRFFPSCSEYAIMAINKDGVIKGTVKSVWRILKCNPLHKGGIDYP